MQREALPHLGAFGFPSRWSWLIWSACTHGLGFFLSLTAPKRNGVAAAGCQWRAAVYARRVRMDACRDPAGTHNSFPALGSPLLPGTGVIPTLPLLFALASVCVNTPAVVAKGSNNRHEETKSLQGIPDATVLMGKIFYYPVPVFAFQGMISQYKVMLLNTLLGTILQQIGIHFMFKMNSLKISF